MDGFITIDKPAGITSHDVISFLRRTLHQKKIGHTGTLDPFATGVLPIALGEATKAITFLDESLKSYRAVMHLGVSTDTQDLTGKILRTVSLANLSPSSVETVVREFAGRIEQLPPMFSAIKRNGVPLYRLARQGTEVERESRLVEIHAISIESVDLPLVTFSVDCSRGTYVRSLANDIGERLGCGAHLKELRRTASGPFGLTDALTVDRVPEAVSQGAFRAMLISPYDALHHLPDVQLTEGGQKRVSSGISPVSTDFREVSLPVIKVGDIIRLSHAKRLVAVAECISPLCTESGKNLKLLRVFN